MPHAAFLAVSVAAKASLAFLARVLSSLVTIASSPSFLASASFAAFAARLAARAASPAVIFGALPPPPPALAISMTVARPPLGFICDASGTSASSTFPFAKQLLVLLEHAGDVEEAVHEVTRGRDGSIVHGDLVPVLPVLHLHDAKRIVAAGRHRAVLSCAA